MTNPEPEPVRSTYDPTREPQAETPPDEAEEDRQEDEIVGVPGADPREPSMPHGSSGQDAGSMD